MHQVMLGQGIYDADITVKLSHKQSFKLTWNHKSFLIRADQAWSYTRFESNELADEKLD